MRSEYLKKAVEYCPIDTIKGGMNHGSRAYYERTGF